MAVRKITQFQLKSLIQFRSAQSANLLQNSERNKPTTTPKEETAAISM